MEVAASPGSAYGEAVSGEPIAPWLIGIQTRFRESIFDRIMAFETLKKDVESGRSLRRALRDMAGLAHKIAGVAGTLGYPHVGHLAAEVDLCITLGLSDGSSPTDTWRRLHPALDALLDELETLLDP